MSCCFPRYRFSQGVACLGWCFMILLQSCCSFPGLLVGPIPPVGLLLSPGLPVGPVQWDVGVPVPKGRRLQRWTAAVLKQEGQASVLLALLLQEEKVPPREALCKMELQGQQSVRRGAGFCGGIPGSCVWA